MRAYAGRTGTQSVLKKPFDGTRGRAMVQTLKAQSFNWVATDAQEVPSTA